MTALPPTAAEQQDIPPQQPPIPQAEQPRSGLNLGRYGKLYAAVAGLAITLLTEKYAGTAAGNWLPYVVALASALGVYATPNQDNRGKK